jgi:hypothetical protein
LVSDSLRINQHQQIIIKRVEFAIEKLGIWFWLLANGHGDLCGRGCELTELAWSSSITHVELPEDAWRHIYCSLPMRDAARAACVSRRFLRFWRCYPNLTFNQETVAAKRQTEASTSSARRGRCMETAPASARRRSDSTSPPSARRTSTRAHWTGGSTSASSPCCSRSPARGSTPSRTRFCRRPAGSSRFTSPRAASTPCSSNRAAGRRRRRLVGAFCPGCVCAGSAPPARS